MSLCEAKKILVVDDQANWRLALRVLLESEGYQVSEAASFQEATEVLQRKTFDLTILDVRLVDEQTFNVQGLELLQLIKESAPLTKTIILTGYSDSVKGGPEADAILFKVPSGGTFDSKEFKEKVREFLPKR